MDLRGKLGRNASIVLNKEEVDCINLILTYRETAKIHSGNPYLFGVLGQVPYKFLNASLLLKKYVNKAELQNPERFFATTYEKIWLQE